MSPIEEKLTDQFYAWELYGRGWYIWNAPVAPEPPFRPFLGHYLPREHVVDDGRRPTFFSSLVARLTQTQTTPVEETAEEEEAEPEIFERAGVVELQTSLPLSLNVSKENIEQLLFSLGHCREPISFEIIGCHDSIIAQFAASETDVNRLQTQLEANFADGVFIQQNCVLENKWRANTNDDALIVQFGLSREFMIPILATKGFGTDPFIGITAAMSKLCKGETAVFQVLFQRVRNPWGESILRSVTDNTGKDFFVNVPELSKEARNKISRPLYAATVRIAVKSEAHERTMEIARGLVASLSVFSNPHTNEFIPLENRHYPAADHEEDLLRRQSRRCGMILNSDELIALVHLPSSSIRTPKFKREGERSKAAPSIAINPSGMLLGENYHGGKASMVRLTAEQRVRHAYVIGASGTGKSTFLFNLIRQDIENGQGVAVLDPHGDLVEKICGIVPENRINDVVLLDPSDEEFSIGFNILSAHSDLEKNLLASDLVSIFQRLSTSWGDQMGSVFNNAILAFLESRKGGSLADLRRFLIEPAFRNQFLESVSDPDIVYYWKKAFPTLAGNKSVGSVLTRLDTFLSPKPIRYMVSQRENRLDFADIMNSGKIFLAKLSQGKMGRENSYLMGSLLVAKFQQAAMGRQTMLEKDRRNFWLHIDEFHNFITPSMAEILTGARKYRVGMVLAHQEVRQLHKESDVASAVLSAYTRVCFRVGDDDARKLSDGFAFFETRDLQSLSNFSAICRVERADYDFNLTFPALTEPDERDASETRSRVIAASRAKYAVSRQQIEAEQAQLREQANESEPSVPKKHKTTELSKTVEAEEQELKSSAALTEMQPKISHLRVEVKPALAEKPPERSKEQLIPAAPVQEKGIGGHQHNLIRERIECVAQQLGYSASREHPTDSGGKIDVVLKKHERAIACEIAITTTIDHEVGNVSKCLKAGFKSVVVISPSNDRLEKIRTGVAASLSGEECSLVGYYHPDAFITRLQHLALQDTAAPVQNFSSEKKYGKYRVKNSVANLTAEEIKERESIALGTVTSTMRKKK